MRPILGQEALRIAMQVTVPIKRLRDEALGFTPLRVVASA
jgi:hypothetical protein